jgi:hypothetical protein
MFSSARCNSWKFTGQRLAATRIEREREKKDKRRRVYWHGFVLLLLEGRPYRLYETAFLGSHLHELGLIIVIYHLPQDSNDAWTRQQRTSSHMETQNRRERETYVERGLKEVQYFLLILGGFRDGRGSDCGGGIMGWRSAEVFTASVVVEFAAKERTSPRNSTFSASTALY